MRSHFSKVKSRIRKNPIFLVLVCPLLVPAQRDRPSLFINTDKVLYTTNEYVWFTAFELRATIGDQMVNTTLHLVLADATDKKVALYSKYIMDRGIAMGAMKLPDSLPPGEYFLLAYTDHYFRNGQEPVFNKWISIRSKKRKPRLISRLIADSCIVREPIPEHNARAFLQPDSTVYHIRAKTKWKIKITDENGKPVQGVFSISCALTGRFDRRFPDITKYYYGHNVCQPQQIDTGLTDAPDSVKGWVTRADKQLKNPATLIVLGQEKVVPLMTRSDGTFAISPDQLAAQRDSVIIGLAGIRDPDLYSLQLDNRVDLLNNELAARDFPIGEPDTGALWQKEDEKANEFKMLQEAVVTAHKQLFYNNEPLLKDSSCDAWVCIYDHIYCPNSPRAGSPEINKVYFDNYRYHGWILYKGCRDDYFLSPYMKKIEATQYPRSFCQPDFCNTTTNEKQVNTTVYWNYLVATDAKGEAEISFYTNDLTGYFTCILQGLSTAGPISAQEDILVINK